MLGAISSGAPITAMAVHSGSTEIATTVSETRPIRSRPTPVIRVIQIDWMVATSPCTRSISMPGELLLK